MGRSLRQRRQPLAPTTAISVVFGPWLGLRWFTSRARKLHRVVQEEPNGDLSGAPAAGPLIRCSALETQRDHDIVDVARLMTEPPVKPRRYLGRPRHDH
jgi:hypothetical protein